ncbi:MAG: hypothetical protein ACK587_17100, partial [Cyanobacteriota bacterium]
VKYPCLGKSILSRITLLSTITVLLTITVLENQYDLGKKQTRSGQKTNMIWAKPSRSGRQTGWKQSLSQVHDHQLQTRRVG